jgi:tetratricopeptide (TPR) repeat protein
MDQFSAHLDRGWDLIQRGDTHGAETSARRALELDKEAPEAYNLLGYIAALHGEFEDALEHYQQAIALDDTYLEAMLNAAEVLIHPLGELEEAERLCDDALELAESEDERVDALLLKFDALLGQDQIQAAKTLCARLPAGPFENPAHTFLVGRALYEIGEISKAAPLIEQAAQAAPANAESFYYLGLLRDEQGKADDATRAFLRSRELEVEAPRAPWALTADQLRDVAAVALGSLPAELHDFVTLENTYIADLPGVEVIVEGVDPRALLLLDAAPDQVPGGDRPSSPTASSAGGPGAVVFNAATAGGGAVSAGAASTALEASSDARAPERPTRLFIYQRNVERISTQADALAPELSAALEREIRAAFFDEPPPERA